MPQSPCLEHTYLVSTRGTVYLLKLWLELSFNPDLSIISSFLAFIYQFTFYLLEVLRHGQGLFLHSSYYYLRLYYAHAIRAFFCFSTSDSVLFTPSLS